MAATIPAKETLTLVQFDWAQMTQLRRRTALMLHPDSASEWGATFRKMQLVLKEDAILRVLLMFSCGHLTDTTRYTDEKAKATFDDVQMHVFSFMGESKQRLEEELANRSGADLIVRAEYDVLSVVTLDAEQSKVAGGAVMLPIECAAAWEATYRKLFEKPARCQGLAMLLHYSHARHLTMKSEWPGIDTPVTMHMFVLNEDARTELGKALAAE
jgi:hypothetical protein